MHTLSRSAVVVLAVTALLAGCRSPQSAASSAPASNDQAFTAVAHQYLEDLYRRQPTQATYLGIHKYDDKLENYSRAGGRRTRSRRRAASATAVSAIDAASLSPDNQLDREQLLHAIDSRLLTLDVVRPWATRSGHLQQRPDQHRLHHDQARVRAARRAAAQADRAREGDAGGARRGAKEPRQPAADLHRRSRSSSSTATASFFQTAVAGAFPDGRPTRRCSPSSRPPTTP